MGESEKEQSVRNEYAVVHRARKNGTNQGLNNKVFPCSCFTQCLLLTMPGALVPTNRSFESVRRAKRQKMNGLFQSVSRNPGPVTIKKRNAFSPSLLFLVSSLCFGEQTFWSLFTQQRRQQHGMYRGSGSTATTH